MPQYLCALLMPTARARDAQLALRAFNIETASISGRVTDQRHGKLRFGFWGVQLNQMFGTEQPAADQLPPVMQELTRAHLAYGFTRRWLDRILQAREADTGGQPSTIAELEEFGEATASSLLYLSLETLGVRDVQADHAASHLGKALSISSLLRSTPAQISRGQVLIPAELFHKHLVPSSAVMRGETSLELQDAAFELASQAKAHLDHAREMPVPTTAVPALLPAIICDKYLHALEKANFDLFDPQLQSINQFWLQVELARNSFFQRF